jgi:hypothetical protein
MSLFDALEPPIPGLRLAALTIHPDRSRHCTLCEGPLTSAHDGWAPVLSLYAGTEQLAIACAHCVIALRKMEKAR